MTTRIASLLFGLLLLPVHAGYSMAFYHQMLGIRGTGTPQLALLFGVTGYLAVHTFLKPPKKLYEAGQKIMNLFFLWMRGGKDVAKADKGKTKSVGFTELVPYVVPIYTILVTIIYGAASMFTDVAPWTKWFFFALGFTMTFHLVYTVEALKEKQSEMGWTVKLLNIGFVYWSNLLILVLVVNLVVPHLSVLEYVRGGFNESYQIYKAIYDQLFVV